MTASRHKKGLPSLKILSSFVIGLALLIFTGGIIAHYVVNMSFMLEKHERLNIQQQGDIISSILTASTENIQSVARDWASWDETFAFAVGENDTFIDEHLAENYPLLLHNFNFIAIKDLSGADLYTMFFDVDYEQQLPVPDGFTDLLTSLGNDVVKNYQPSKTYIFKQKLGKDGFLFHDGICYYICSMPILTSDETAGPVGSFFFGRIFNDAELNSASTYKNFNSTILDLDSPEIKSLNTDSHEKEIFRFTKENSTYYKVFQDYYGNDTLALKIEAPRDLYKDGMQVITFAVHVLIIVMLLLAATITFFISRYLLRPINLLISGVKSITVETDSIDTSGYSRNLEFSILGSSINMMLDRLKQNRIILEESTVSINVLKNILNGMDALLYVSDPQTDEILFINDRMKEQFGLGDDAVGSTCWKVLQSGFEKRCDFCQNLRLLDDPNTHIAWEEHNTVTGRYYKNIDCIIEWSNGEKVHLQHSTDITEIKVAEEALNKRLKQQELMSSISQSFISNNDMDAMIGNALETTGEFMKISRIQLARYNKEEGTLTCANQWCKKEEDFQLTNAAQLPFREGMPLFDILKKQDYAPLVIQDTGVSDMYKNARAFSIKAFLVFPIIMDGELWGLLEFDNTEHTYEWSSSDIHLGSLFSSLLTGVVSRQVMEQRLLLMSSIIDSSPQYISYINKDGKFNFVNPATYKITGYSHDELVEGGLQMLYGEETCRLMIDEFIPTIISQGKYSFEIPLIRKDGQVRMMSFSTFTIGDDEYGFGAIAKDITEEKRLELELVDAKEAAEQASRTKSEFLSRMSHEMRTPMNAIIGMTSIAQSSDDSKKKDYCLEKIDGASKHLLGVINDVLDMSKIEANKFELSLIEFSFEKMLQKVVNVISFRIDEKQQSFTVHIDNNIPHTLIGDDQRLAQVITNLLSNAVKFTPDAGTIRLDARFVKEESGVCTIQFEVTDTGIGISEEQQSRLFNSFEQAENSTSRKYGGTGLGLAISKRIVELMGGRIWIESEPGMGSTFAFTVEVGRGEEKHQSLLSPGVNWNNIRVLVVDDMSEIREYFADIVGHFGVACDTASGGHDAIDIIEQRGPYDLYFVDWKMPEMDGIELSRRIKMNYPRNSVIIMISSTEWTIIETEAKNAGVDKFLAKPLFASAIADCINECLGTNAIRSSEDAPVGEIDNFEGYRVLLAEDVEINREIVLALLEPTSLAVDCAENGAEAVRLYSEAPERYDLIFMDVQMPEMDGFDATRRIRELNNAKAKAVPIIAMTANVFREDIEMCLAAGMNDHIGKPLGLDEILDKIRKYLL